MLGLARAKFKLEGILQSYGSKEVTVLVQDKKMKSKKVQAKGRKYRIPISYLSPEAQQDPGKFFQKKVNFVVPMDDSGMKILENSPPKKMSKTNKKK